MPSLENAYLQRDRAKKQVQELQSLCSEFCATEQKATITEAKTETTLPVNPEDLYRIQRRDTPIPEECGVLAGEIVRCLRAALNCLTSSLAELDSGVIQPEAHFPIESTREGFQRHVRFLSGISESHVAAIEALQPYNRCDWTRRLVALSDLHESGGLIKHVTLCYGRLHPVESAEPNISLYEVKMHFQTALFVATDKGLDLVKTLKEIESQVTRTLDAFQPEFE